MGGHDHHTNHCTNPAQCAYCGKDQLSRSSDCEVWKKEKEIMKLKVTKNLTYPEARKLYDQQQPEFNFTKVVQSLFAQPETKTAYTQYNVEDSKITESSKVIVAKKKNRNQVHILLHRQQPVRNRRPVRKTERIYHQINRHQDNQTHKNKQTDRVRPQNQQMTNTHQIDSQKDQMTL